MLDFIKWDVEKVVMHGCTEENGPSVTATLSGTIDRLKLSRQFYSIELINDLCERLYVQPSEYMKYCQYDTAITRILSNSVFGANAYYNPLRIKNVIFNNPATIIFWRDGTKTVVKAQNGEPYDPEKGFVMAYLKRLLGNDNTFNKEIHKWVK